MRKTVIILSIIIFLLVFINIKNENDLILPNDAIRLRIVPNSNSNYDQFIKGYVRIELENKFKETVDSTSVFSMRKSITENLENYKNDIDELLKSKNYNKSFTINYGNNYFPAKNYKGVIYPAGEYESLVVVLGDGAGDNWWCVMFPPLCSLEVEEKDDIEYRFYVKDMFEKYLSK